MYRDSFAKKLMYKLAAVLPDKLYLSLKYRMKFGKNINWENPQTFNEKLQWLKVYDRNPLYTTMVDKYAAKQYVANIIGEEHIIPTLGVWDRAEDIDFDSLPDQFVLKATHDSGRVLICRDKSTFDREKAIAEMNISLKRDFYAVTREWPYKNVPRRIIAEKYMEDSDSDDLEDYKLMCFNGEVCCSFVCSDRNSKDGLHVTFFDKEWNRLPFTRLYPASDIDIEKPKAYHKMLALAQKLSKDIPFVRTDFYEINNKLYFGELTFYPGGGFEKFTPDEWDERLGKLIVLPPPYGRLSY